MGLLNQMGYVNNNDNWELSPAARSKAAIAANEKIEEYIADATQAAADNNVEKMNFGKEWAHRIAQSAFSHGFINDFEKLAFENRINAISAP
jgi:hypothetical protein